MKLRQAKIVLLNGMSRYRRSTYANALVRLGHLATLSVVRKAWKVSKERWKR